MPIKKEALADPVLLDKIDRLFACNVGEYIDLPQLVVVGDQSSGRSSVLEAKTRLPFPRDSGLCTRYASQIIFRRRKDLTRCEIKASMIPAAGSDSEHGARLKSWDAQISEVDPQSFARVMEEARPDEDHLSVIDVPGIFKNNTPGITTKTDIKMVREMVLGYMKNPRSIMLMVIPSNVDIATQEIIEMARELDPEGGRTFGVLTKPDLVDQGAEAKVMDIVLGRTMPVRHGWVVIRNLGQRELEDGQVDRDAAEEQFGRGDLLNAILLERFGIGALRRRLQEVITENARRSFPLVRSEITKRLKEAKAALRVLGEERETTEQQAAFLLDIISRFQQLATQAFSTNYGADNTFDEFEELRLATIVMNRSTTFCEDMALFGHKYEKESDDNTWAWDEATKETGILTRKIEDVSDLADLLPSCEEELLPLRVGVKEWLMQLYTRSRGFEVGTFNTCLLARSMNKQSSKWPNFALGYCPPAAISSQGWHLPINPICFFK
ncbi:hypothetical protein ATERTT37_001291 [Aspergillus terreus]